MALKTTTRVDMPEKGIFPRRMGNAVYITILRGHIEMKKESLQTTEYQ